MKIYTFTVNISTPFPMLLPGFPPKINPSESPSISATALKTNYSTFRTLGDPSLTVALSPLYQSGNPTDTPEDRA